MQMVPPPGVDPFDLKEFRAWKAMRDRIRKGLPARKDPAEARGVAASAPRPHQGGSLARVMHQIANAEKKAAMLKRVTFTDENRTVLEEVCEGDLPEIYDPTRSYLRGTAGWLLRAPGRPAHAAAD